MGPHSMDTRSPTHQQYFLPNMCRAKNVLYLTLISQLLAITLALNTSFLSGDFWNSLSLNALFILWVAFICAAIFCTFKRQINRWSAINISLFMFLSINLTTLLLTWLITSLLPQLEFFPTHVPGNINIYLRNTGISLIFSAVLLRFLYIQFQWRKQTQAEAEAKLDALQARIHPHFLFNSLNTIASLTRIDPPLAESLIEDLSELFRANMQTNARLVAFKDEFELVRQYLNIEQNRLGTRLAINIKLNDIPPDALVPPLSIQPLVENAIYHGIEPSELGGELSIIGSFNKNIITLTIKNPISPEATDSSHTSNHIAVENIRLRMQNCFPEQSSLSISASGLEFLSQLKFPYQTHQP